GIRAVIIMTVSSPRRSDESGRGAGSRTPVLFVLRYLYLLALVVWIGGIAALGGVAAPALFETLPRAVGPAGRELAGAAFGEILRRFHLVAYGAASVMLASLVVARILGPRPVHFGARTAIVSAMLGLTLCSGVVVGRRIAAVRAEIRGPVAGLPDTDPRRIEFGRLHALSTVLMLLTGAAGLALLAWEARE
ncbi:MAG TPA: DUF4149 domain-containing protein, partial [Vicinamibacterales bacterium]|nr:DUF4149 domain-containing protein [Vicinamibacterales bacterium]